MRKVILGLAVSLDGFIEGPQGEYDWCFTDQDYGLSAFFKRVDAIFMGRKSYDLSKKHEGQNPWKGMTTYVFSRSMKEAPKGINLLQGDKEEIIAILQQPGKDIWLFGGAMLTATLMKEGLVDELWLSVHPILLGGGKPLFQGLEHRVQLKLMSTKSYNTGLVSLIYQIEK